MPTPATVKNWSLVAAVNNERVLQNTMLASPAVDAHCQVIPLRGAASSTLAYNEGLQRAEHEIVVFAHQDVYFPAGWVEDLSRAVAQLAASDPDWGVLGVFGMTRQDAAPLGYCYSTGLKRTLGAPFAAPVEAQALDELVLVLRRSSGLTFDPDLPGFHLYGTDICLRAAAAGKRSYIVSAFCVHNSNGLKYFGRDYWRSYLYMRRKWWSELPVTTPCSIISRSYKPMVAQIVSDTRSRLLGGKKVGTRRDDVQRLYESLPEARRREVPAAEGG